jgi:hypothetical protein
MMVDASVMVAASQACAAQSHLLDVEDYSLDIVAHTRKVEVRPVVSFT